jgi:hypothetical protein
MTRNATARPPCPLCGRITRTHSVLSLADIGETHPGDTAQYSAVICRDCAFSMVLRTEAHFARAS